ncbi:MAG: hypothetical protein JO263_08490 [Candidatus Eremiobacteraeota bacterium]|nr:hypothetical protein [Candidatus Eremiobacteraeota bacterium]
MTHRRTRGLAALCGIAFAYQMFAAPAAATAGAPDALTLLNSTSCGSTVAQLETPAPAQTPANSPSPSPTPTLAPIPQAPNGPVQIYVTPVPSATPVTPPPVPTPTPSATPGGPVFVIRPTGPPPTIAPVSPGPITPRPSPTATPTGIPTLPPGYIAVLADQVVGNTHEGEPGDAIGNVNIFYGDEILVGERAHYDGVRTFTVVGNPYIINRAKDSILHADVIYFDTVTHVATLKHGEGESTENVERGKVYFSAQSLTSTEGGVAHGDRAFVTTCEHPHGGYHLTGRAIDVTPGDKLTITKAVLFLGGLAIMYIPKVVIPLRQEDEQHRVSFFPQLGYDQAEGAWIKMKLAFGHDQYYNGYYTVNYFTKVGLGLGYTSFFNAKNGRRSGNIYFYEIHDRRTGTFSANGTLAETENFSRTLRNQFNFNYNGNYGPFTFIPSNTVIADTLSHTSVRSSQTYTYNRSATGTQSDVQSYGFTDHHQFTDHLSNDLALSYGNSQSNFAGVFQSLTNSTVNDLVHFITPGTDFQLNYLQNNYQTPSGVNKIPELAIRPNTLFSHFRFFPIAAQFYIGQYSERQTGFETSREDLSFQFGPALLHVLYSDFSLQVAVDQYIYGTGDLKARVTQNASMNTRITKHIVNTVTYN